MDYYPMNTITFPAIILTLALIISLFHLSTSQTQNLVQDICQQAAQFPPTKSEECLATFASNNLGSPPSADLNGLAQITLKSGIANATEARKYVEGLVAGPDVGPVLKEALMNCSSWFSAAVDSFNSALMELDEDLQSANYDAKIAGDDARNCRGMMAAGKVSEPSVEVRVGYVVLYSNIADAITDSLYKKSLNL